MMLTQTFAANQVLFMVLATITGAFFLYAGHAVYVALKDERERAQNRYNGDELGGWQDDFFPPISDN